MLNANKLLTVFKDAVDYGINNTGGEINKIDRFKLNTINKFKNFMKKVDKDAKVYDFRSDDIKDGFIITVADDYEVYLLGLPFVSQLTYYENGELKLIAVYSYVNELILYTFNSKEMYSKDKHISLRYTKKPKNVQLVAIDDVCNKNVVDFATNMHNWKKVVSYYSTGVALFKLILGEIMYYYCYGLDKDNLKEILWLCECNNISITVTNGIYKFSRSGGD